MYSFMVSSPVEKVERTKRKENILASTSALGMLVIMSLAALILRFATGYSEYLTGFYICFGLLVFCVIITLIEFRANLSFFLKKGYFKGKPIN